MPNSDLIGKDFEVKDKNLIKYLGDTISYENMKKIKSELENYKTKNNFEKYKQEGGDLVLSWLNQNLTKERDAIYNVKKTKMDAGQENQFKKEHTKDRDNSNPTGLNLPNMHKGSMNRQIMSNKVTYNEEIKTIKYLIEYMDNNKTKI